MAQIHGTYPDSWLLKTLFFIPFGHMHGQNGVFMPRVINLVFTVGQGRPYSDL